MSEHEQKFIREYCRKLMVSICDRVVRDGDYGVIEEPYKATMLSLGWLSKRDNHLPTAKGWKIATSFLKR